MVVFSSGLFARPRGIAAIAIGRPEFAIAASVPATSEGAGRAGTEACPTARNTHTDPLTDGRGAQGEDRAVHQAGPLFGGRGAQGEDGALQQAGPLPEVAVLIAKTNDTNESG
jgi:hypothetical protein